MKYTIKKSNNYSYTSTKCSISKLEIYNVSAVTQCAISTLGRDYFKLYTEKSITQKSITHAQFQTCPAITYLVIIRFQSEMKMFITASSIKGILLLKLNVFL